MVGWMVGEVVCVLDRFWLWIDGFEMLNVRRDIQMLNIKYQDHSIPSLFLIIHHPSLLLPLLYPIHSSSFTS